MFTARTPLNNRTMAARVEALTDWDQAGYPLWLVHQREGQTIGEYETTGGAAWAFFVSNGGPEADPHGHLLSGFDTPEDGDVVFYARRIAR